MNEESPRIRRGYSQGPALRRQAVLPRSVCAATCSVGRRVGRSRFRVRTAPWPIERSRSSATSWHGVGARRPHSAPRSRERLTRYTRRCAPPREHRLTKELAAYEKELIAQQGRVDAMKARDEEEHEVRQQVRQDSPPVRSRGAHTAHACRQRAWAWHDRACPAAVCAPPPAAPPARPIGARAARDRANDSRHTTTPRRRHRAAQRAGPARVCMRARARATARARVRLL